MDPDAGARGGITHGGEHLILGLGTELGGAPLPVAVEETAHLRREQHRRPAGGRRLDGGDEIPRILRRVDAGPRLVERDPAHPPASIGSSRPARSSSTRSSEPPTWRPSMKICGTVWRPFDRSIISSRLPGIELISYSSYSTPLSPSSALARAQ